MKVDQKRQRNILEVDRRSDETLVEITEVPPNTPIRFPWPYGSSLSICAGTILGKTLREPWMATIRIGLGTVDVPQETLCLVKESA